MSPFRRLWNLLRRSRLEDDRQARYVGADGAAAPTQTSWPFVGCFSNTWLPFPDRCGPQLFCSGRTSDSELIR
jgi:hypothetical protein